MIFDIYTFDGNSDVRKRGRKGEREGRRGREGEREGRKRGERKRERERGKERKEKNVSVLHANTCVRVYACVCMRDCV